MTQDDRDSELKFTASDLLLMPENHERYEVIDGELYVHDPTHFQHQHAVDDWLALCWIGVIAPVWVKPIWLSG